MLNVLTSGWWLFLFTERRGCAPVLQDGFLNEGVIKLQIHNSCGGSSSVIIITAAASIAAATGRRRLFQTRKGTRRGVITILTNARGPSCQDLQKKQFFVFIIIRIVILLASATMGTATASLDTVSATSQKRNTATFTATTCMISRSAKRPSIFSASACQGRSRRNNITLLLLRRLLLLQLLGILFHWVRLVQTPAAEATSVQCY